MQKQKQILLLTILFLTSHALASKHSGQEHEHNCEGTLKALGVEIAKFGEEEQLALPAINRAFKDVKENCGGYPIDETEQVADITFGEGTSENPKCMGSFLRVFYQLFNHHFKFLMKDSEIEEEARTPSKGFFKKIKKFSHSKIGKSLISVGGGVAMGGMSGMGGGKAGMLQGVIGGVLSSQGRRLIKHHSEVVEEEIEEEEHQNEEDEETTFLFESVDEIYSYCVEGRMTNGSWFE